MKTEEVHAHLDQLLSNGEIPDNTKELIPVTNRVRKWAAENAYLLIFLTIMNALGWVVTIATN